MDNSRSLFSRDTPDLWSTNQRSLNHFDYRIRNPIAKMALLKVGLPTFFLIGVSVLLVLTSHVFQAWDPSVGRHNGRDEFGSLIVSQLNTSLSRLAVPFGAKTILRNSLSNVLLVNTSHSKRDGWYIPPYRNIAVWLLVLIDVGVMR